MPRRTVEAEVHSEEVKPQETQNGFTAAASDEPGIKDGTALPAESAAQAETLEEAAARKQLKKKLKAQKKAEKKKLQEKLESTLLKEKISSTKVLAAAFPMVALIDEQVRTSIPEELVARVKAVKSKKEIISSNYPYTTQMKESEY